MSKNEYRLDDKASTLVVAVGSVALGTELQNIPVQLQEERH